MTDEAVAGHPDLGGGPSNRTGLFVGAAVGLVICAVVGAIGGYLLAGDGDDREGPYDAGPTTPTAQTTSKPPRSTPSRTPSRRASSTPPPIGQMILPDLVGKDFQQAREELRRLGLGVQFIFGSAGNDPSVASTNPRGGTAVKRGITVRVTVVGEAPEVVVPALVGESCKQAARRLVDDGLYPQYPTKDRGDVRNQDPPGGTVLRWNQQVRLYCSDGPASGGTPTP
ncbi:PASTA domain-containing protein [Plantactinospora sp. KLBMP9567]|uniref:PASTA domain-containing protein n=1 Tax=Plantactinospora sp. KLBMP9567 TaxID=3085900 RepID=UPI002981187F|nr:PASTA domain-containing protein [Plantactinospora sp. KLBMP9567]MDW5327299.1 PASTA domain-containing protein [Plantactinospora sp. KLBMP9567]